MADRRRINGPLGGTAPPTFVTSDNIHAKPSRTRKENELRSIFLQTGIIPAANGSAYLELKSPTTELRTFVPINSTIKLSCAVHGPKPLARGASFTPNLQLNASIKFAPFASRQRRGYIRDSIERDLGAHLENALKGVIIPDRWPKSSIDIAIMVLEGEEDSLFMQDTEAGKGVSGVGLMNVLAGSVTVAAAALADAGVDCLDMVVGGVSALIPKDDRNELEVLDPCPSEHEEISSACFVAYLPSRDEVTEIWSKVGHASDVQDIHTHETLLNAAIKSARGAHTVLTEVVQEAVMRKYPNKSTIDGSTTTKDVEMAT